jgi:hypothetical protein
LSPGLLIEIPGGITVYACRMAAKAIFAIKAVNPHLDIIIPGSDATIHVWWLNITLVMSAVFGFAEHSLCVAWASTFRGERWIELSHYAGTVYPTRHHARADQDAAQSSEPLLPRQSDLLYP